MCLRKSLPRTRRLRSEEMFGSIAVKNPNIEAIAQAAGSGSLALSLAIGMQQCRRPPDETGD